MIKILLCCSLLVGSAQAMAIGQASSDDPFGHEIIIDLSFLYSESVPEKTTAKNGPSRELWENQTICQELLEEPEKKDSPEKDSKLLAMLKEFEKKESQDEAKNSEE